MKYRYALMALSLSVILSCGKKRTEESRYEGVDRYDSASITAMSVPLTDLDLIKLDKLLEPIRQEIAGLNKRFGKYHDSVKDSLIAGLNARWGENRRSVSGYIESEEMYQRLSNDSLFVNQADSLLRTAALKLGFEEGMPYITGALGLRADLLTGFSKTTHDWLKLTRRDAVTQWTNDAGIVVPLDTIAAWALDYELFEKTYPKTHLADLAKQQRMRFLNLLITGMDNTPAFWDNRHPDAEFLAQWKQFAEKERSTASGKYIGEWYALLKSEGFLWTRACETWIATRKLSMSGAGETYVPDSLPKEPKDTSVADTTTRSDSSKDSAATAVVQ